MSFFTARLAPHFADQPDGERLYEVITPDGERVASTTLIFDADRLADNLNHVLLAWEHNSADAVVG